MRIFAVGGSVRDALMGIECNDHDYVVVGSTEQEMLDAGFKNVGAAFPVFLHPETGDEYALARREKKIGPGYKGFAVEFDSDVTLTDDLGRRDLTLNCMAQDIHNRDHLYDPFNGLDDLHNRVLRHATDAFKEDPLRVVRLARFYARFTDFTIAPETVEFAKEIVDSGEMDTLSDERFWAEMEKMFNQSGDPYRFFEALWNFGAITKVKFFKDIFGDVDIFWLKEAERVCVNIGHSYADDRAVIFTALMSSGLMKSVALPTRAIKLAENIAFVRAMAPVAPEKIVGLINANRGWNTNNKNMGLLFDCIAVSALGGEAFPVSLSLLMDCQEAGTSLDVDGYLHLPGKEIGIALVNDRLVAVRKVMEKFK